MLSSHVAQIRASFTSQLGRRNVGSLITALVETFFTRTLCRYNKGTHLETSISNVAEIFCFNVELADLAHHMSCS